MAEFTGERLVPGQVDPDLWNEHFARYAFASRLARRRRVLDAGCGTGYGAAELALAAASVTGADLALEAVAAAAESYRQANLQFVAAPAEQLPFRDASFDLVVAFEVIEHLQDWPQLLEEARRLLAPGGQFIVSTPNKLFYAESRRLSGPNPYHVHEFEFEEFRAALEEVFPSVTMFLQNHAEGIIFQPCREGHAAPADVTVAPTAAEPESAHFFVAVCAARPQTGAPAYVYLPTTANVLREREHHILKLESELRKKDEWLEEIREDHTRLLNLYASQTEELNRVHEWGTALDTEIRAVKTRIVAVQNELEVQRAACVKRIEEFEAELARTEATVVERTNWALQLQQELDQARAMLAAAQASRWLRLGRRIGIGPDLKL